MRTRGKLLIAGGGLALVLMLGLAWPYLATAGFLLDVGGVSGGLRRLLPGSPYPVTFSDVLVPTRHGAVVSRVYRTTRKNAAAVAVFPGVHGGGVDAPRLARMCRNVSSTGLTVVCTPLPDLRQFEITGRSTDMIEDVTLWAANEPGIGREGRVTLTGVSFAGGLALVASGRPALRDRLDAVVSIGGHGDLGRTLRYLTSGVLPDGSSRPPHDYGLAVVALTLAEHLVPADQVEGFETGVRTFLEASLDERPDFNEARRLFAQLDELLPSLPEPSRGLVQAVKDRDVARVGRAVAPFIDELGNDAALSPALSPPPAAPVFLLHGSADNVIPSSETPLAAADFERRGTPRVTWLLTPVVSHAHLVTGASPMDLWRLVRFWRDARRFVF